MNDEMPLGVHAMIPCDDEIETNEDESTLWRISRLILPRIIRLTLFFVMQGVAVIMVGFAALFLSFEPVWSAQGLRHIAAENR
jgi:hypothetical protein